MDIHTPNLAQPPLTIPANSTLPYPTYCTEFYIIDADADTLKVRLEFENGSNSGVCRFTRGTGYRNRDKAVVSIEFINDSASDIRVVLSTCNGEFIDRRLYSVASIYGGDENAIRIKSADDSESVSLGWSGSPDYSLAFSASPNTQGYIVTPTLGDWAGSSGSLKVYISNGADNLYLVAEQLDGIMIGGTLSPIQLPYFRGDIGINVISTGDYTGTQTDKVLVTRFFFPS